LKIIEHPKADELYALGDKAGIDEAQVNDLYQQCKSVYHEEWEPALREALANKAKDAQPEAQEALRKKRVVPTKVTHAANLLYKMSMEGRSFDEELLDVVIAAAETALGLKKPTKE
jgi:hypothetical protein